MDETEKFNIARIQGQMKAVTMMSFELSKLKLKMGINMYGEGPEESRARANKYARQMFLELEEYRELEIKKFKKNYFLFITIRPKETTVEKLLKFWERISKYKWTKNRMLMCIEQIGETENTIGKGVHMHILYKIEQAYYSDKGRATAVNKTNLLKKLKEYLTEENIDCKEPDIREKTYEEGLINIKYMKGKKQDDKMEAVKWNKEFRENYKLNELYWNDSGNLKNLGSTSPN